jgi:hypothetical protein
MAHAGIEDFDHHIIGARFAAVEMKRDKWVSAEWAA